MFFIKFSSQVKRDIRKLPKALQEELKNEHFPAIQKEPFSGDQLSGPFKGLWSYHLSHAGKQYRVAYEIFEDEKLVMVIKIGPREGFYEKLRQRLGL